MTPDGHTDDGLDGEPQWLPPVVVASLTVALAAIIAGTCVWAAQGLPFQDDWKFVYPMQADGSLRSGATMLFRPINDGVWPLFNFLVATSWAWVGSLTPIVLLNVALMAVTAVSVLAWIRRTTGSLDYTDVVVPMCCLNFALLPTFTWGCVSPIFICGAAVIPLSLAMTVPGRIRHGWRFTAGIAAFLVLTLANGTMAYTLGMGVALWSLAAAVLMPGMPAAPRAGLAGVGIAGVASIVAVYLQLKTASPVAGSIGRSPRVFIEMLASGVGSIGMSSRGTLGLLLATLVAAVVVAILRGRATGQGTVRERLLGAATAGVLLMPCIGVALARPSGLAIRYVPYCVPLIVWVYAVARGLLAPPMGRTIAVALATLFGMSFLYEAQNAWTFAKGRHEAATALLRDAASGMTPLQLASGHAAEWLLSKDEAFAAYLRAARGTPLFRNVGEEVGHETRLVEPASARHTAADGWVYWTYRIDDPQAIAMCVEYQPRRRGPYRLRWHVAYATGAAVPTTFEEASFQGQEVKRRDYVWLEPGAATVWFGVPESVDPQDVRGSLLTKRP
jgi:hypothetical protein